MVAANDRVRLNALADPNHIAAGLRGIVIETTTVAERGTVAVVQWSSTLGLMQVRTLEPVQHLTEVCERCGGDKPADQSCGCFDNGGQ